MPTWATQAGQFPVAEKLCRTVLSLPIHPLLSEAQLNYIASTIRAFFAATSSIA